MRPSNGSPHQTTTQSMLKTELQEAELSTSFSHSRKPTWGWKERMKASRHSAWQFSLALIISYSLRKLIQAKRAKLNSITSTRLQRHSPLSIRSSKRLCSIARLAHLRLSFTRKTPRRLYWCIHSKPKMRSTSSGRTRPRNTTRCKPGQVSTLVRKASSRKESTNTTTETEKLRRHSKQNTLSTSRIWLSMVLTKGQQTRGVSNFQPEGKSSWKRWNAAMWTSLAHSTHTQHLLNSSSSSD